MKVQRGSDGTILNAAVLAAPEVTNQRVLCPACMYEVFERWPEEWEAHAVHRCDGVSDGTPEQRKEEFRRVLGHLFREDAQRERPTPELEDFVTFVQTLAGRVLQAPNGPFTVAVSKRGLLYTPQATGDKRLHRYERVQLYLDQFAQSGSLDPAADHDEGTSYMLALFQAYIELMRMSIRHAQPMTPVL